MRVPRFMALALAVFVLAAGSPVVASAAEAWPAGTYQVDLQTTRIGGADRFGTAVAVAQAGFPGWAGVDHVIIASGDDGSLSDPLAAASLCWAYDAPLLLVGRSTVPSATRTALQEMVSVNTTVTVTVVGGTSAVREPVLSEIAGLVGAANVEQPWPAGDRYSLAAGIALRTAEVAEETSRTLPVRAFVANGTDAAGFADALALSAISARTGAPVLLVERDRVPEPTAAALTALPPGRVCVAGGTAVVSGATYSAVGATLRIAGRDRYATAAEVAASARYRGWLTSDTVGLASTVADALTGATLVGRQGGPVLHVGKSSVPWPPASYLHRLRGTITKATLFGGPAALTETLKAQVEGAPASARIVTPVPGSRVAKKAYVTVQTGVNTTELQVFVGSTLLLAREVGSFATVDLGAVTMPAAGVPLKVVVSNPAGMEVAATGTYGLHSYPAPTSIVVDKSDFALYWFKDDVLVKTYPIAIGKPSTPTPAALWRIDSKYHTDPRGVYGPRKMRLYRKVGSSYVYTAYGIHGTNQPWVIGTMASHGCIRLTNDQILDLFPRVPLGTLVQTRE